MTENCGPGCGPKKLKRKGYAVAKRVVKSTKVSAKSSYDSPDTVDLVISFDTTGSMSSCIGQVRKNVVKTVNDLFRRIPNLRIGIISHGDYCDRDRCINVLDLTDDQDQLVRFIKEAPDTGGGDADECYELVLQRARSLAWTGGTNKALVVIGDCNPHAPSYTNVWAPGKKAIGIDWKNEATLLREMGVKLYPIQALGRREADSFYAALAAGNGIGKLTLPQFADITDIISGICYGQAGPEQLQEYRQQYAERPSYQQSPHVLSTLAQLAGETAPHGAVLSGRSETIGSRYQVLPVDEDIPISQLVTDYGLRFEPGRGFYELKKTVLIQGYKEVVAMNNKTHAILTGIPARKALGIPVGEESVSFKPAKDSKYTGFVQSTSFNRKLLGGTRFLYEIKD